MSNLEKSLKRWTAQGLINQNQADNIKQYEDSHAEKSWMLYGCLILGSVIIGIGAISLIAANWSNISDTTKLVADFFTLFVLSVFIVKAWSEEKPLQFEILLLTFMLFTLASIGLIAQIYHTNGEFYQALMLWSLITFPL